MFNTQLAVQTLAQIELAKNNEIDLGWDQTSWSTLFSNRLPENHDYVVDEKSHEIIGVGTCGTAQCFAGWALTLSSVKMRWAREGEGTVLYAVSTEDGDKIDAAAGDLLGIEQHHCDDDEDCDFEGWDHDENMPALFSGGNNLNNLYSEVARLAGVEVSALRETVAQVVEDLRLRGAALGAKTVR